MTLIIETEKFVTELLTQNLSRDHRYHDLPHTLAVRDYCLQIGKEMNLSEEELEILELASLLHDTGFTVTYEGHEVVSRKIAENFLEEHDYPKLHSMC